MPALATSPNDRKDARPRALAVRATMGTASHATPAATAAIPDHERYADGAARQVPPVRDAPRQPAPRAGRRNRDRTSTETRRHPREGDHPERARDERSESNGGHPTPDVTSLPRSREVVPTGDGEEEVLDEEGEHPRREHGPGANPRGAPPFASGASGAFGAFGAFGTFGARDARGTGALRGHSTSSQAAVEAARRRTGRTIRASET